MASDLSGRKMQRIDQKTKNAVSGFIRKTSTERIPEEIMQICT